MLRLPEEGYLEVITGPMFAGKSEELIRRVRRAKIARQRVIVFKHSLDKRYAENDVVSHGGLSVEAIPVSSSEEIVAILEENGYDFDVVAIDEAQFFDEGIINVVKGLLDMGKRVIVAGLDLDFRGEPFGPMPQLLALADEVTKLKAVCMVCGAPASRTQRLIDGRPASLDDPVILVGASETYEPRCKKHHTVAKRRKSPGEKGSGEKSQGGGQGA